MSGNVTTLDAAIGRGLGVKPAQVGVRLNAMVAPTGSAPIGSFRILLETGTDGVGGYIGLEDDSGVIELENGP